MHTSEQLIRKTFFWDRIRGAFSGISETAFTGFALIIAIQVYDAPDSIKGLIAAAGAIGLTLNPLSLSLFSRIKMRISYIAGILWMLSTICMGVATASNDLTTYLVFICLTFIFASQTMPLLVQIWTTNYPTNKRGTYLSGSMMISIACTLAFSLAGGSLLDKHPEHYWIILAILTGAYFFGGLALSQLPSEPLKKTNAQNPLTNLNYAFTDRKFGIMLLGWMFLGFGNLMILPLRFDFLLQPEYGIEASKLTVAIITLGIPAVFRFSSSRFWGILFDRINFLVMRMALNIIIMVSVAMFFLTNNLWVIALSAALHGIGMGGGNISWSLWVTKFAPPEKSAAYMSVHTFSTGVRGIIAPFVGFSLLSSVGPKNTGIFGAMLIVVSIIMVFALYLSIRKKQKTTL